MKRNKILLTIAPLKRALEFEKLGISNFLFPLESFSIGYETLSLKDIEHFTKPCYILVNRILTDEDIDTFLKLEIPENVVGLVLEDIGLYYAIKDSKYELILFQNHLNNSSETINFWLERVNSLVVSTDITLNEIEKILNKSSKPLVLNTLGYPMIMYSRRRLISNYREYADVSLENELKAQVPGSDEIFDFVEGEYGTAVFDSNLLDAREEFEKLDDDKIKYYLFNGRGLSDEELTKSIKGQSIANAKKGFLYEKTIYKVGDVR